MVYKNLNGKIVLYNSIKSNDDIMSYLVHYILKQKIVLPDLLHNRVYNSKPQHFAVYVLKHSGCLCNEFHIKTLFVPEAFGLCL